jgi:hypothetical protein
MCERRKYCAHLTLIKKKYVALRIMRASFHRKLDFASQNERKARCILTRALGSLCRSGSFARVRMMQAADLWDLDHLANPGRLDSSADRRILVERQMRTAPFVVCKKLLQGLAQASLTEDQDVVQTLPSNGSDQALRVGVLPGDCGAVRTSRIPIHFAVSQNFSP